MSYIDLPDGLPGLIALMGQYPDVQQVIMGSAEALLRGPSPLSAGEREVIAARVSYQNGCDFCLGSHRAAAEILLGKSIEDAARDPKMAALLVISDAVTEGGSMVTETMIADAKACGADDKTIHDTVLVASFFCMINRYIDGLHVWSPAADSPVYQKMGEKLANDGYSR